MSGPTVVHVVPQPGGQWQVRVAGEGFALSFMDLGLALDAATLLAAEHRVARVVVHESPERKAG